MEWPRISIVVVNLNLGYYLRQTLKSIVSQEYPALELIVIDGGSTDDSLDVIREYEPFITKWVSETDEGQYEAVEKGLKMTTGDIMAWLNSDDLYLPNGLFAMGRLFRQFPEIEWIQGHPVEYNEHGEAIRRIHLPWARWSKYRYLTYDFQFIQQESTFWRRSLWEKAGAHLSREHRLAGDMELWARFFRHAKLYTAQVMVGGFRHRAGQRSKDQAQRYMHEAADIVRRERKRYGWWRRRGFDLMRYAGFPFGILYFLDIPILRWVYRDIYRIPPVINLDFDNMKYRIGYPAESRHPPMFWRGRQVRRPVRKDLD